MPCAKKDIPQYGQNCNNLNTWLPTNTKSDIQIFNLYNQYLLQVNVLMGPFTFTLICGHVVDRRVRTSIIVHSDTAYNTSIG